MRIWFHFQSLAGSCVFKKKKKKNTQHNASPTCYTRRIVGTKSDKKTCHHLHPVRYYHYYWYRTFSEQLVIEFGRFMASSALSIDAVQNHYSDFLEMNHLWTWPRDKKKKKKVSKAFKEILPSLPLSSSLGFFSEKSWLRPTSCKLCRLVVV